MRGLCYSQLQPQVSVPKLQLYPARKKAGPLLSGQQVSSLIWWILMIWFWMKPTNLYPVASRTLSAWIFWLDPLLVATVTLAAERVWICPSTVVMLPLRTQSMYPGGSTCKAPDKAFARGWLGIFCGRSCWLLDLINPSEIILNICFVDHFPNEDSAMKRWNTSGCSANGN